MYGAIALCEKMYNTYLTLLVPAIAAFAITVIATKFFMSYMLESGVIAIDYNKKAKPKIPSAGGVAVSFGIAIGVLTYIFGSSFPSPSHPFYLPVADTNILFAFILSVILITLVGFIDDINVKSSATSTTGMKDIRKGLKQWQKPFLTLIGAIPLVAINAGVSSVAVPFVGNIYLGLIYPLLIIPLAIIFGANAFNLLGGFNGISTGSGIVISAGMLIYSILFGTYIGALISAILFAALVAFAFFDFYPSKLLPGDSFTYGIGGALIALMIIGNMESFGIVIFMPYIIEFILHLRGRFNITDLGKLQKDMTFKAPYGKKIYSLTHVIMNMKKCKEYEVSAYMWLINIGFVVLAFALKLLKLL